MDLQDNQSWVHHERPPAYYENPLSCLLKLNQPPQKVTLVLTGGQGLFKTISVSEMTKKQLCRIHPWHLLWHWDWNQPGQQVVLLHLCSCWTVACQAHKQSNSNVFDVALQGTLKWSENTREGVQTAHAVSNWHLLDWFLTCATCFLFVWSHYSTLCSNMFEKHIFHKFTSLLFFFF